MGAEEGCLCCLLGGSLFSGRKRAAAGGRGVESVPHGPTRVVWSLSAQAKSRAEERSPGHFVTPASPAPRPRMKCGEKPS